LKKKIGIMGGTFDPIHNGHLILAEYSRIAFDLEKVIFIPTGRPPHKVEKQISSINYRYDMTLLAISTNPYFYLSPMEIQRQGTTYTIDTIMDLQKQHEDVEFYFILGADSFNQIHKWKDSDKLLSLCKFIVAKRPDADNQKLGEKIEKLNQSYKGSFYILEAPLIDISSTKVRNRIKTKSSIKYLVPETVELYIEKNKLYE
jgi:nicotinate-nucleotide adenylyltransferase